MVTGGRTQPCRTNTHESMVSPSGSAVRTTALRTAPHRALCQKPGRSRRSRSGLGVPSGWPGAHRRPVGPAASPGRGASRKHFYRHHREDRGQVSGDSSSRPPRPREDRRSAAASGRQGDPCLSHPEIEPLVTEAAMTEVSVGVDDKHCGIRQDNTTVALDFGRITWTNPGVYISVNPGRIASLPLGDLVEGVGRLVMSNRTHRRLIPVRNGTTSRRGHAPCPRVQHLRQRAPGTPRRDPRRARGRTRVPIMECDAVPWDTVEARTRGADRAGLGPTRALRRLTAQHA